MPFHIVIEQIPERTTLFMKKEVCGTPLTSHSMRVLREIVPQTLCPTGHVANRAHNNWEAKSE